MKTAADSPQMAQPRREALGWHEASASPWPGVLVTTMPAATDVSRQRCPSRGACPRPPSWPARCERPASRGASSQRRPVASAGLAGLCCHCEPLCSSLSPDPAQGLGRTRRSPPRIPAPGGQRLWKPGAEAALSPGALRPGGIKKVLHTLS